MQNRVPSFFGVLLLVIFAFSCFALGFYGKQILFQFSTKEVVEQPTESIDVNPKVVKQIDRFFQKRFRDGSFNGTVLFADHGKIVYKNAFGYKNFGNKTKLEMEDAFQLASVSKPLTSLAILQLHDRGLVNFDDPVQKFIPEFPYEGINVRHLLIHKSGLPNYMYFADDHWPDRKASVTNEDVLCMMETYKPSVYLHPNKKYNYSNTNYALLASIVNRVSGLTFEDYMARNIFQPSGMNSSLVYNSAQNPNFPSKVLGYDKKRRRKHRVSNNFLNGVVGDKGVYSNVEDLLKLDQLLYTDSLVNKETLQMAFSPAHERLYAHDNYGLGWRINTDHEGQRTVFHGGWWKGFRTYFIRELYSKRTIIVLSNITGKRSSLGTNELRNLFHLQPTP